MDWQKRSAYVFIKTAKGAAEKVWSKFQTWDHCIGAWIVTGEWDVVAWFDASSWDDVYKWTSEIRTWEGVDYTSSHFVYSGYKNKWWWWQKPYGAWIAVRGNNIEEDYKKLQNWDWVTSVTSIPGTWDYLSWVWGDTWDEVWNRVVEVNSKTWETLTLVPVRTWWNKNWETKWW
jgi:hypothetical protein